jgi:proteasome lid subunit RPN8/RPN11
MKTVSLAPAPPTGVPRPEPPVRLHVTDAALDATHTTLRELSDGKRESLVLWAGRATSSTMATITELIVPETTASRVRLEVPMRERIAVANRLRAERLLVFADLHTHPGAAFLSELDRSRPFSVRAGFYAIVVPDFARRETLDGWTMFETDGLDWVEVSVHDRIGR